MPVDGGGSVPLLKDAVEPGAAGTKSVPPNFTAQGISPDGRWVTGFYWAPGGAPEVVLVSASGSEPWRQVMSLPRGTTGWGLHWLPEGPMIHYILTERGVSNVWVKAVAGEAPRQWTSFTDQQIARLAWSRDGRNLAVSRVETTTGVVLITSEGKK